jgi:protein-S-isoprenylcysteine O-methyltransferase Ste14
MTAARIVGRHMGGLRPGADAWPIVVAGVALILLGSALRTWSVLTLGRFFRYEVMIEEDQTIVRHGPYRLNRHPAYLGTLVAVLGVGLALGGWPGAVVASLVTLAGHLPRIHVEEAALADAFPDAYSGYARETARLVPGIW